WPAAQVDRSHVVVLYRSERHRQVSISVRRLLRDPGEGQSHRSRPALTRSRLGPTIHGMRQPMPNEPVILAIDQGTTGTTALLVDETGKVVARGYREVEANYPRPGWIEQDAEHLWRRRLAPFADARRASRDRQIGAIVMTN